MANNLLDKAYLATIAGQGAFIGAPRTILAEHDDFLLTRSFP